MSDEKKEDPDVLVRAPAPAAPATEAAADEPPDYLFRAQLALTSFYTANGRYLGWVAMAGLGGVLVWGLWSMWQERSSANDFGEIAAIDYKMPKPDPMSQYGLAPADDPTDAGRKADLEEGARRFEAAAKGSSGSAAVYGYLKAAEAWERAGNAPSRLAALKAANELGRSGLPGWSAGSAYASALIDAGSAEEAIGVYRELAGRTQGFYAQQALLSLATAQIDLGKNDDAKQTVDEYATRFPTAPQERAEALRARATGVPPAAAAPSAPGAGSEG